MPIPVTDVSASLGAPPLHAVGGLLQPVDPARMVITTVALAQWNLVPGTLPVNELLVAAHVHVDRGGALPFLATVVFMDPGGRWALGKTYRVDFPNDQYDPAHDRDLRDELRKVLCR
jgi:hypothetical protein